MKTLISRIEAANTLDNARNLVSLDSTVEANIIEVASGLRSGHSELSIDDARDAVYKLSEEVRSANYDSELQNTLKYISLGLDMEYYGLYGWGLIDEFDLSCYSLNCIESRLNPDSYAVQKANIVLQKKGYSSNNSDRAPVFKAKMLMTRDVAADVLEHALSAATIDNRIISNIQSIASDLRTGHSDKKYHEVYYNIVKLMATLAMCGETDHYLDVLLVFVGIGLEQHGLYCWGVITEAEAMEYNYVATEASEQKKTSDFKALNKSLEERGFTFHGNGRVPVFTR